MKFSKHAVKRLQQRGIRRQAVRLVLAYGDHRHRHGAAIVSMDRDSRLEAACDPGRECRRIVDRLNVYAVVADGNVLTVAHPRQRPRSRRPSPGHDVVRRGRSVFHSAPSCRPDR